MGTILCIGVRASQYINVSIDIRDHDFYHHTSHNMQKNKLRLLKLTSIFLLLIPYLLYVGFVIHANKGPVDYETFLDIGHRLINGSEIYGENSYYPMPFVMVFALFSWLPRPISMAIWLLAPVITALLITKGNPFVLLYAPTFAHFVGGQTAIFGMIGLWGYRKYIDTNNRVGGIFLGLTLLKPQLAIIPLAFACIQWWKEFHALKHVSRQAWAFVITAIVIYLPGFLLLPNWPSQWLSHPRPLFIRAMSGFIPRTLLYFFSPQTVVYWFVLVVIGILVLWGIWVLNHKTIGLDLAVVWSFIVSPLVHDYDLIQLIPLLEKPVLQVIAVLLSIPGWLVIIFAYSNNSAWYVFTIIAPGILCAILYQNQKVRMQTHQKQIANAG
jgi:hypothetical protein